MSRIEVDNGVHRRLKTKALTNSVKIGDLASVLLDESLKKEEAVRRAIQKVKGEPLS